MLEKIKSIIAEQLNVGVDTISLSSSLKDDLGADSLDLFELVMALEEEFETDIPTEDLSNIDTVEDIMNYLKSKEIEE